MALPSSGNITLGQVAAELGIATPLTLGDSRVRELAGVASGPITLGALRGKSAYTPPTIASVSPSPVYYRNIEPPGALGSSSASCTISISGGEAPFAVAWARQSGSTAISVTGGLTGTFVANNASPFSYSSVWRATVTDNKGNSVQTANITVTLESNSA